MQTPGRRSGCGSRVERGCAETRGPGGASHVLDAPLATGLSRRKDSQPGTRPSADQESTWAPLGPARPGGKTMNIEGPSWGGDYLVTEGSKGAAERCAGGRQRPTTRRPGPSRPGPAGRNDRLQGGRGRRATSAKTRSSAGRPGRPDGPARRAREDGNERPEPGHASDAGAGRIGRTHAGRSRKARDARTEAQSHRRAGTSDARGPERTGADEGVLITSDKSRRAARGLTVLAP